jgi:hypothetical protein
MRATRTSVTSLPAQPFADSAHSGMAVYADPLRPKGPVFAVLEFFVPEVRAVPCHDSVDD